MWFCIRIVCHFFSLGLSKWGFCQHHARKCMFWRAPPIICQGDTGQAGVLFTQARLYIHPSLIYSPTGQDRVQRAALHAKASALFSCEMLLWPVSFDCLRSTGDNTKPIQIYRHTAKCISKHTTCKQNTAHAIILVITCPQACDAHVP